MTNVDEILHRLAEAIRDEERAMAEYQSRPSNKVCECALRLAMYARKQIETQVVNAS